MDGVTKHGFDLACAALGLKQKEGVRGAVDLLLLLARNHQFVSLAFSRDLTVVELLQEAINDAVGREGEGADDLVEAEGLVPSRVGSVFSKRRDAGAAAD